MKRSLLLLFLAIAGLSQAQTDWNANVYQNTLLGHNGASAPNYLPKNEMVSDGSGGVLLLHSRLGTDGTIGTYMSHWSATGMYANSAISIPNACLGSAITDRNSGVFFMFVRDGDAYVGRINSTPDTVFMNFKLPLTAAVANVPIDLQTNFSNLVEDGSGKAVLSYVEKEPSLASFKYYNHMAKVDINGAYPWVYQTLVADSAYIPGGFRHQQSVYTGDGGIISAYSNYNEIGDPANAGSFAFNRTDVNGTRMWDPLPRLILPNGTYSNATEPFLIRDELGGTWLSFMADSSGSRHPHIQRVRANGTFLYDGIGKKLDMATSYKVTPDRNRGLLVVIGRTDGGGHTTNYLDHIIVDGTLVDSMVTMDLADQVAVELYASNTALYVLSQDTADILFLSKFTHSGQRIYGPNQVCGIGQTDKRDFHLLADADSGMYISWTEDRNPGYSSYYAMHMNASGDATGSNTGIQARHEAPSISIYPQPAQGWVNVNASAAVNEIEVYDLQGRRCAQQSFAPANDVRLALNLPSGMYLLHVKTEQGIQTARLMVE